MEATEDRVEHASPPQPTRQPESGFYEAYAGFARNLRIWFIAYGIGGPTVFLTNQAAGQRLLASGASGVVAYTFLAGVALQILIALLYKTAMWYLYMGELDERAKAWRLYKASDWFSSCYCFELLADIATLGLFAWATVSVLRVFLM